MSELKQLARLIFLETLAAIDIADTMQRKVTLAGSALSIESMRGSVCGGAVGPGVDSEIVVNLADYERIRVVAIGKASVEMAQGLARVLAPEVSFAGIVVAPHVTPQTGTDASVAIDSLQIIRAGHPEPDAGSFLAARAILDLLKECDARTLVIFLLSGGGSPLVELPLDPAITLEEMQEFHRLLVRCGAPIDEINTVRKHLSAVKGGRLAAAAPAAMKLTLGVTDVPAGRESALGSGPTIPDPTTVLDACRMIDRYALLPKLPPAIRAKFDDPAKIPETPKAGDPAFARSRFLLLLGMNDLFHHAHRAAEAHGFKTVCDNSTDDWPLGPAADYLLAELSRLAAANPGRRVAVIADGEVSSPVIGDGIGGRNSAFVLECAGKIAGIARKKIAILSAGTDGKDGSSPAAGAVADTETFERAKARGLDPAEFARGSDSYNFFRVLGDTIETGPMGNNLRDLRVLLAE
jgi:glycerate 2-kinase